MMKNNLSSDILQGLQEALAHAPSDKLDRIKKVVAHSGYSEEVVDAFLEALGQIGDKMSMTTNLEEALALDEVKEYLKQKVDEAVQDSETAHQNELANTKAEFNNELQILQDEKEDLAQEYQKLVVDSIVILSTILRKDVIDFDDEAGSQEKYRKELSSSSDKDLKEMLSGLRDEYIASFSNVPTKSLGDEVNRDDGQINPAEGSDDQDKNALKVASLGDVLRTLVRSVGKSN